MAIKTTQGEFSRFWDEVLGDDWCIEETDLYDGHDDEQDPAPETPLEGTYLTIAWQGLGRDFEPTTWISNADVRRGVSFNALWRRWKKRQTRTTVVLDIDVDKVDELKQAVKALGGKIVSGDK